MTEPNLGTLTPLLKNKGMKKTDMDCHHCRELGLPDRFIANLDFSLEGNFEIVCPRCSHVHMRVVKRGVVTSERYDSSMVTHKVERKNLWKASSLPMETSVASQFIRDRWLSRGQD